MPIPVLYNGLDITVYKTVICRIMLTDGMSIIFIPDFYHAYPTTILSDPHPAMRIFKQRPQICLVQQSFLLGIMMVFVCVCYQAVRIENYHPIACSCPYISIPVFSKCFYTPHTIGLREKMPECQSPVIPAIRQIQPFSQSTYPHPAFAIFQYAEKGIEV